MHFCIQMVGLEVGFRQYEERSVDGVGVDRLLKGFDLPTLVTNYRVHSLDVEEEGVGDRRRFLHI